MSYLPYVPFCLSSHRHDALIHACLLGFIFGTTNGWDTYVPFKSHILPYIGYNLKILPVYHAVNNFVSSLDKINIVLFLKNTFINFLRSFIHSFIYLLFCF